MAAGNPRLVYASISGFGSGPKGAALPGYDLIVQAISGLMSLTGDPDGEPYRAGISVFDVMAGLHATIGVLSALNARHETGRGQHVEVNLLSSALSGLVNQSSAYVAGGVVPFRMGNSHPSLFPYEPLPCADGELIITAGNNGQFRKLVEVLGVPELADDPRFARNEDRTANRERAAAAAGRAAAHPHQDGVVPRHHRRRRAVRADQHRRRRRRVRRGGRARPRRGRGGGSAAVPSVRNPIRFSDTPADYRLPPPALDEHGEEIRRWLASRTRAAASTAGRASPDRSAASTPTSFPTSLGTSTADEIRLLGQDLTADLMGKVGFGELAFWLVALRRPTPSETRVFEAVLVALADHGFTPTAIAARLTYLSAPDSLQGALAAGLLGGGSRFLGVTEDCGTVPARRLAGTTATLPTDDAGWDELALEAVHGNARGAAGSCPASATRCTRCRTRARRC